MAKMKEATSSAKKRTISQVNDVDPVLSKESEDISVPNSSEDLVSENPETNSEVCIIKITCMYDNLYMYNILLIKSSGTCCEASKVGGRN